MSVERGRCVREYWSVGWPWPGEMTGVQRTAGHSASPYGKVDVRPDLAEGERQWQARKAREAKGRLRAPVVTQRSLTAGS